LNEFSTAMIWNVRDGSLLLQLEWEPETTPPVDGSTPLHPRLLKGVSGLSFSLDNRTVIAVCNDARFRVWELATGELRVKYRLQGLRLELRGCSFTQTNRFLTMSIDRITEEIRAKFPHKPYAVIPIPTQFSIFDAPTGLPPREVSVSVDREKAWAGLTMKNAVLAYEGMRDLAGDPEGALFLEKRLLANAKPETTDAIEKLVHELHNESFEVRERASRRLKELGDIAIPVMSKALADTNSAEVRRRLTELLDVFGRPAEGDRLRVIRAVEILEATNSDESRRVLKKLAEGDSRSLLSREAKAALKRLNAN
jgi:hypothetical protein